MRRSAQHCPVCLRDQAEGSAAMPQFKNANLVRCQQYSPSLNIFQVRFEYSGILATEYCAVVDSL